MTQPQPLSGEQQNAFDLMQETLRDWGLESLGQTVYDFLIQGYSQQNISLMLRDTDAYKTRFAGNEIRKRQGLPVLSPSEYLSVEKSYRQIMRASGVPEGFWDQQTDFNDLIGRDVSPVELQRRVDTAENTAARVDESTHQWFREQYGLDFSATDRGALTAYVLDPARGMDAINRVVRGGSVAGAARNRGVNVTREQAERFGAAADDTQYMQQANAFADLANRGGFLSELYRGNYDVESAGAEVFLGDAAAEQQRKALVRREQGEFGGGGSSGQSGLNQASGSF